MNQSDRVTVDPEILGGTPVFRGTRVPVKTLLDYLEDNDPLDQFLEYFSHGDPRDGLPPAGTIRAALLGSPAA